MTCDNADEVFPIVDDNGKTVGKATRNACHNGSMLLHPVVHLHVFNTCGELYLQRRPAWKDIQPDRWDTAVGGHVDYEENVEHALHREAREELSISDFKPFLLGKYVFTSQRERELVYSYYTIYDGTILPSEETAGGKFWNLREIQASIGKNIFTPNFEEEYVRLLNKISLVQKSQAGVGDFH